jgi:hypothetical protein
VLGALLNAASLVLFLWAGHLAVATPETARADFLAPALAGGGTLLSGLGYVACRSTLGKRLAVGALGMNGAAVLLLFAALL